MRRPLAWVVCLALVGSVAAISVVMAAAVLPVITLSPTCGMVGTSVAVTGSHFAPGSSGFAVTVTFDPGGQPVASVQVPASAIDPQGNFTTTLTVPARPLRSSPYQVVASQTVPAGVSQPPSVRANFQLPCTALLLDPACGSVRTPIAVVGTGFRPDTPVTITFTPPSGGTPEATVIPKTNTTFVIDVPVPNRPPGDYLVVAEQSIPGAVPIQLTARARFVIPCAKPTIVLTPTVGPPGTVVTVTGTGFPSGAMVKLSWTQGIRIPGPSIAIGASQGFQLTLLIYPHDELGPRRMNAGPDLSVVNAPLFNIATADFLVVPGTAQPHDFSWRR